MAASSADWMEDVRPEQCQTSEMTAYQGNLFFIVDGMWAWWEPNQAEKNAAESQTRNPCLTESHI